MWNQTWNYVLNHPDKILDWTLQHLYIILVANAAAAILGVLIGIHTSGRWEMNKRQVLTNRNLSLAVPMTGREQRKENFIIFRE